MAAERWLAAGLLAAATACEGALPPLRGVAEVGRDPLVVFVGGTGMAGGDLFAVPAAGGEVVQLTYSAVGELRPAVSPDGGAVAFLRGASLTDSTPASVWVMNLLSGAERGVELPRAAGVPEGVGWTGDGRSLVIRAGTQLYQAPAPPDESKGSLLPQAEWARAESALAVLVGRPAFGRVMPCADPGDLCVAADTGPPAILAAGARDGTRWGDDSVAYFRGDLLLVRPLGPGRERRVEMRNPPRSPRQATVFAGRRTGDGRRYGGGTAVGTAAERR